MEKILIVEDSKDYQKMIETILGGSYELFFYKDAEEIIRRATDNSADLILLDVVFPEGNGFDAAEVLQNSRFTRDIPILFVTGQDRSDDVLKGLNLGADDYIVKPFDPIEFRARVEARLKKARLRKERDRILRAGNLILNTVERRAFLLEHNAEKEIQFLPFEFQLLTYFVQNCDRNISRDEIFGYLAKGKSLRVGTRNIDAHISSIRRKTPELGQKIRAVYGVGYRFHSGSGF